LFFLSDHDLLTMLSDTFNDLPALQPFFEKFFPKLSNIILLDGTDLTVSKKVTAKTIKELSRAPGLFLQNILGCSNTLRWLPSAVVQLFCLFL